MNRNISGFVKAAASLSLAGGILAAAALPAAAASPNFAVGVQATGVVVVNPVARAAYPGISPVTAVGVDAAGLITTGLITDRATATTASSTIANVGVTLAPLVALDATAVTSACHLNTATGVVSGKTTITGGTITGLAPITGGTIAPNTGITVPGVATITLNRQFRAADGTLTVDAIYVTLLSNGQTITIAKSVCNTASLAAVPVLPTKTLAFSLTGLGALLIAGLGYQVSRRRRQSAAAA
ncbi:MAG: hypothetical protein M3Z75_03480 [Actinomycetota bacterium]|nr:hypothetical protein [Actinomycetota bacterium]